MGSKPLRTKRKSASIESCLRPLGATIDMATPDMWTSNRLWEGGIVALIFTKRQLKGRGGYWVVSPSGNCCVFCFPGESPFRGSFLHFRPANSFLLFYLSLPVNSHRRSAA